MYAPGESWLLAVSGGCDSMAMMVCLASMAQTGQLTFAKLHVAHLDHQLRGDESAADAAFVREQAQKLGLPFTLETMDVARLAAADKESIELTARRLRYEFLARLARQHSCTKIALAHNADDNAETILHRILRGTGIRGLAGIPAVRSLPGEDLCFIRPLLSIPRAAIEEYEAQNQIPSRHDRTNLSRAYTRNRIRLDLLPLLKQQYNPQVVDALLRLGRIAEEAGGTLEMDTAAALQTLILERTDHSITLPLELLQTKTRAELAQIIRAAMDLLQIPQQQIGFRQIAAILNLIQTRNGDETLLLPAALIVERTANQLILLRQDSSRLETESAPPLSPAAISLPGRTSLAPGYIRFDPSDGEKPISALDTQLLDSTAEILASFRKTKKNCEEILDYDAIREPLLLRTWQEGDRFWPLGAAGDKTLGDFFTDVKIPAPLRRRIPLLCDQAGILWVLGLRIAHRARITPQTTRILRLTILSSGEPAGM